MIHLFSHKGLALFFTTGSKVGIQAKHEVRLNFILALLDQARRIEDMNAPGLRLHQLKGKQSSFWSVTVQAKWRMIFKFEDGNAYVVDYMDYH
jgi:proteic killer suppression protein